MTEAATLESSLRSKLSSVDSMPALPAILRPLLEHLRLPAEHIQIERVTDLVAKDKAIAAQLLRMANSSMFWRSHPVETVRTAVITLGVERVRDIVLSCCLMSLKPQKDWPIPPTIIWEHAFGCALMAQHFAKKIGYPDPEKAYLAGLLHDLGFLVNSVILFEEFRPATARAVKEGIGLYEAEQQMLGLTHCETGAALAEHWQMPPEIRQAILHHHDVTRAEPPSADLVAIVSLSDLLCRMRGLGYGYAEMRGVDFQDDPAWVLLADHLQKMSSLDTLRLTFELDDHVEEIHETVAAVYRN